MKRWGLFTCIILVALIALLRMSSVGALTDNPWFDTNTQLSLRLSQEGAAIHKTTFWGVDCREESFDSLWLDSSNVSTKQRVSDCIYQTPFGHLGSYGVRFAGTKLGYTVRSKLGTNVTVYPTVGSSDVLTFARSGGTGYFKYLYVYKDLPANIQPVADANGDTLYYKLINANDGIGNRVKFTDGSTVIVQDQSLVHAADGNYIFANFGRAQALIDVSTQTARIIGQNTNQPSGSPDVTLGVNHDASVVFVADNATGSYKLYSTTNCSPGSTASSPEQCESRDIGTIIRTSISNIRRIVQVRFVDESRIELFISVNTPSGPRTDRYILTSPGYTAPSFSYLALGDSFASGEGAGDFTAVTDIDTNHCHISSNSYGYLVKADLSYADSESVACSGAKIKDVYKTSVEYSEIDPQGKGKDEAIYNNEIFDNFLPGYRRQFEFVKQYHPEAITLSIGGNDISFGKKLAYCILTQYNCYESPEQKQNILNEIKVLFPRLVKTYTNLHEASPDTRIYVLGYPKLVLPGGDCALNVHLSQEELTLADQIVTDLDAVIKRATQSVGVGYVDVSDAFVGHRLCEDKSWNLAVNGITLGTDQPYGIGPISSATFHPNKMGHKLFEDTILSQTTNLTKPMPDAHSSVNVDDIPSLLSPDGNTTGTSVLPILDDGLFGDIVQAGETAVSTIKTAGYYLQAGANYVVELHSDPIVIGSAISTDTETLNINAQIPTGVEPGPHEVHIYGKNIAGEQIDIYKNILLIASPDDYDGDGIPNTSDMCTFIMPSNVDVDQDGVDDACDSEILEAPVEVPPILTDDTDNGSYHGRQEHRDDSDGHESHHEDSELHQDKKHKPRSTHQAGPKPKKHEESPSRNDHKGSSQSWVRTVIIFLTTTPIGIGILILLRL